jgi:NAD(P)-dependent dehydrogenase (short-subunit alcohol dehydrogenase family)
LVTAGDFRFDGKRVLVVGGATGMGAAAAQLAKELGAAISVMDVAPIDYPANQSLHVDLRDQRAVDRALAQVDGPIHAVFCCAGVADGTNGLMAINFISQRHLIEALVRDGKLVRGGAAVVISSVAGLPWQLNLDAVRQFVATPDWHSALAWIEAHPGTDNYSFSKQALNGYVAARAFDLLKSGVRINAVLPGPTDTPLAQAHRDVWLGFAADYRAAAGVDVLSPEQVANVIVFLGSNASSGMSGTTVLVDHGHVSAGISGSFDVPAVRIMLGIK